MPIYIEILFIVFIFSIFFWHPSFVVAGPVSTNYELNNYSFGSGGTENSVSNDFKMLGIAGEDIGESNSSLYKTQDGLVYTLSANLPPAASLTNPASYYNKLKVVINDGGNPNDTLYAMAVSTDNFASDTRYVQNDQTVGETLGSEDWQTYSSWGGADGVNIIGLDSSTTYYIKAAAKQGNYTETGFGPVSSASTSSPTISFDIDISASDTETDPPFAIDFGSLLSETITESPEKVWVDFATNGESGGKVYVYGQNGGLFSENRGYTITSATGDLSTLAEGFGAQGVTITQGSGGPFSVNSPYNVSGNNIGVTNSTIREIFGSGNPIGGGRASFLLKAKSGSTTPSAGDYTETLTVIASASY